MPAFFRVCTELADLIPDVEDVTEDVLQPPSNTIHDEWQDE
jgi:hypothetical protein